MSEARTLRIVAVGAAVLALVLTAVAVVVVLMRGGERAVASTNASALTLSEHDVQASDVVKLKRDVVEIVVEKGATKGVRITDAALARTLGLSDGDVITAISGRAMTRETEIYDVMSRTTSLNATTMYVEISRNDKPMLLRWRLDGDLRQARSNARSTSNLFGSIPYTPPSPSYTAPDPDPLIDLIEKVDDTHYKLPRKTVDAVLANPMSVAKGARVVPAMRNGQPDGFKLYAIRPASVYAKLGFQNGDTIHAVNGHELESADDALEVYTKLRNATSLTFDITRRGAPVELLIEITK
jgi:S1-C subfamily serine protease